MGASVILRHDLPGQAHFDWLFEREPGGPLLAFRSRERVDSLPDTFVADRIPDHRPIYLSYEGPLSGGRGSVTRLASGECRILALEQEAIRVEIEFAGIRRTYEGRAAIADPGTEGLPGAWVFTAR